MKISQWLKINNKMKWITYFSLKPDETEELTGMNMRFLVM